MVEVILKMPGEPDSPLSIPPGQYQVGSSEAVPIQLPFVGVSKLHCVLQAQESSLRIADLGSSNGTYLNGQRIGRDFVNVPADSDIEIGSVHILVGAVRREAKPAHTTSFQMPPPPAVPADPEQLRSICGIGPYMAGAIASIAFDIPVPAVDGNVIRVVSRLYGIREDATIPAVRRNIESLAAALVPPERPGDHNQAVMDLGVS